MDKAVKRRTEEIRAQRGRRKCWRRCVSVLSAVVVFVTTYALILPAITMEHTSVCGREEHVHSEACYEERMYLSCDLEETPGHMHDGSCCDEEGQLSCGLEEMPGHTHDENCYSTERILLCGKEEHVHTPSCYPDTEESEEEAGEGITEEPETEEEEEKKEEELLAEGDPTADVESQEAWESLFCGIHRSGNWAEDVLAVADMQLGYAESTRNFIYDERGERRGYTRYGDWYGDRYGNWCAMFCSFCLHYAGVDPALFPFDSSCPRWVDALEAKGLCFSAAEGPERGDLVFFDRDGSGEADHVGLVWEAERDESGVPEAVQVIEGNAGDRVVSRRYDLSNSSILCYGRLPENPDAPRKQEEKAEKEGKAEKKEEIVLQAKAGDGVTITLRAPAASFDAAGRELSLSVSETQDAAAKRLIESEAGAEDKKSVRRETLLFDIRVLRGKEEVQPEGAVTVSFAGIEAPKADAQVFHVDTGNKTAEDMSGTTDRNGEIFLETDHFSLYGVTFTVDFHYGEYDYSILGKDELLLSELFESLNIDRDTGSVIGVTFSDPALISAEETGEGWKLISRKAFNTEERLIITFSDGSELVIGVTDAPAGGVGESYVANTGEVTAVNCRMVTGTAPWDADNAPGNDSSSLNDIVRSFDTIFYNVGYTLNLTDKYQGVFSGYRKGKLYVEAVLPLSKEKAAFDLGAMPWMKDAAITDHGASQTLTGCYAMDAGDHDFAIPATGTLKLAVAVKGMPNGSMVEPSFKLWLDKPKAKSITPGAVTVSAAAHYNVSIRPINIVKNIKLDTNTGQLGSGTVGQLVDCGIYISAVSTDSAKGLRGIYVDLQSVSFYVQPQFYKDGSLLSSYVSDGPEMWEYALVTNSGNGLQGRDLCAPFLNVDTNVSSGRNQLPYSDRSLGNEKNAVFKSGNMTAAKVSGQGIKIDFIGIDSDYIFPTHSATMASAFNSSEALLASGVIQVFYPTGELTEPGKYTSFCDIADMITINGTSVADADTDKSETGTSDNRARLFFNNVPNGDFIQAIGIGTINSSAAAYVKETPFVTALWHQSTYNSKLYCADFFIKFTDGISPDAAGAHFTNTDLIAANANSVNLNIRTLYVAKADGTTWINREEMLTTNMHESGNLRVYTSLSALEAAGATCVGVWLEIRNPAGLPVLEDTNGNIVFQPWIKMMVKESAPVDSIQELILESRSYATNITTSRETSAVLPKATNYIHSYTNPNQIPDYSVYTEKVGFFKHVLSSFDQQYDISQIGTTMQKYYLAGYVVAERDVYREAFSGSTIKVIGENAQITKSVAQEQDGAPRSSYFIDSGERNVDYVLSPRVMANASNVPTSGVAMTTVTVTDTLPKGLRYVPGSAVLGGTYSQPPDRKSHGTVTGGTALTDNGTVTGAPVSAATVGDVTLAITPNGDGSTQLKWILTNVQVGQEMPRLYYSARIGNVDDPLYDVRDGESLTNTANIFSTNSRKTFHGSYGNLSTATIHVFRLENATIQKNIVTPEIDVNKPAIYTITYINNSSVAIPTMHIADLLPYNGDQRGSSFHGSYTVSAVTVERLNDAAGQYALDYTTETSVQGHEDAVFDPGFTSSYTAAVASVSGHVTTLTLPAGTTPTLLHFKGTNVGAYAKIRITVTLNLSGNRDRDVYYNDAAYNTPSIPAPVYTVPVSAEVKQARVALTVKKTVIGGGAGSFPFKITLRDADGGTVILPADTASPALYAVDSITGDVTFSLRNGESVTLPGVPVGTTATVTETGHEGYSVLIKNTTAGGTTLSQGDTASVTVMRDQAVEVVNNTGVTLPSTGGHGILPYLLGGTALCTAAMAAGYILLRYEQERRERQNKRRTFPGDIS
ncbi:DUF7601 domain-containing protein [Lachnoclostridium sp. Marseille-P6806]|uniref:DUF7601 domain-containing protein n=1 Tax=Lachnoclostridium sp. Marseille-P6806 TaxID=2364793 RepID=UPI00102FAAEC|nr:CHAP domain-containing protein [Lachnoclostridium sp. Marseille-P6806]